MAENFIEKAKDEFKKLPKWAWFVAIGGGIFVVYEIKKSQSSNSTGVQANPNGTDTGTLGNDAYQYYMDSGQEQQGYYGGQPTPQPPVPPVPSPQPPPVGNETGTVRSQEGQGQQYYSWDKGHPGVPIRSSTSGSSSIISLQPFGSNVQLNGAPVQGDLNAPGGSNEWYMVQSGGYISQSDLANVSQGQGGANGSFDQWHEMHSQYHNDMSHLGTLISMGLLE